MIEVVKLRVNGTSAIATIPLPFLRAADMTIGSKIVIELLEDKSLRLSLLKDPRLQPFRPADALSSASGALAK